MNQFHITKEEKLKSASALKSELHRLKELGGGKVIDLIATLLEDTTHDSDIVVNTKTTEEYISPNRAASILHASRPYIRKLIDNGTLPAHKVGAHFKIELSEVLALKESWEPKRKKVFEDLNASLDDILNETGWDD